jgi:hypothetical protein
MRVFCYFLMTCAFAAPATIGRADGGSTPNASPSTTQAQGGCAATVAQATETPLSTTAEARSYEETIIWRDESKDPTFDPKIHGQIRPPFASFIPELILNSRPLSEIPLRVEDREQLAKVTKPTGTGAATPSRHDPTPQCPFVGLRSRSRPLPNATSLERWLPEPPLVLVARVLAVVPGWGEGVAREAIFFEPEDILQDKDHCILPSQVYSMILDGGRIQIQGNLVCAKVDPAFYRPATGDRIFLTGICGRGSSEGFLKVGFWARVEGTQMVAQPWSFLSSPARVEISELKRWIGARTTTSSEVQP